jgi:hypothetical protein
MLATLCLPVAVSALCPLAVARFANPVFARSVARMSSTDAEVTAIKSLITSMIADNMKTEKTAAAWAATFDKYYVPTCQVIRPSGNPMSLDMYKGMMASEDVVLTSSELLSIDDVKIFGGGNAAVAVYATHDKFTYKGTPNDDRAVFSAVFDKTDAGWKVIHAHRATGQAPEQK